MIKSEKQYKRYLKRIDKLMNKNLDNYKMRRLIRLSEIVEKYEDAKYPIGV
jgi:antitoxin component HigA of HigAB toxin-antitoxin module